MRKPGIGGPSVVMPPPFKCTPAPLGPQDRFPATNPVNHALISSPLTAGYCRCGSEGMLLALGDQCEHCRNFAGRAAQRGARARLPGMAGLGRCRRAGTAPLRQQSRRLHRSTDRATRPPNQAGLFHFGPGPLLTRVVRRPLQQMNFDYPADASPHSVGEQANGARQQTGETR